MSRTDIRFRGIVRNANLSDSSIGDCEELINVIPENGSLKIVKDKEEVSVNIPYKDVMIHEVAGIKNYIGKDSTGIVWFNPDTGLIIMRLYDKLTDVYISLLNNLVIISDRNTIENKVYMYANDTYKLFADSDFLNLPLSISNATPLVEADNFIYKESDLRTSEFIVNMSSKTAAGESLLAAKNKFFTEHKLFVDGFYLIGINYTLWDGSETGLSHLTPFYPTDPSTGGIYRIPLSVYNPDTNKIQMDFNGFVKQHIVSIKPFADLEKYTETIKSVNIYVSEPISGINFKEDGWWASDWTFGEKGYMGSNLLTYYPQSVSDVKLEKQLLYKVKSFSLKDIQSAYTNYGLGVSYTVEFGINSVSTNKTLEVDSSNTIRSGKMLTFNNRVHLYDSRNKIQLENGTHLLSNADIDTTNKVTASILVYLRGDNNDIVLKINDINIPSETDIEPYKLKFDRMIIIQDSRAYKVVVKYPGYYASIGLLTSPTYNYSYNFVGTIEMKAGTEYDDINVDTSGVYKELSSINVSAQNNPIYFPVEYSYLFTGRIKALGYATEPISQTQIGQYPLYVFTDKGIYAMEQGSGVVLYANQILINTDNVDDTVVQTRNGVIYIANGGVYVLSGRNSLHLSLSMNGPIDTDIRRSVAYSQCCISDTLYNAGMHISQVEFEKFLPECRLIYIPHRDELVVSNPKYQYSYVFSFIYKTWYKITDTLSPVDGNVVQKDLFLSESVAKAAKGSLTVSTVIVSPEHQFTSQQRAIYSGRAYQSDKDERFALIVGGTQISSVNIQYPTKLPIIIALLCKDVPYLDCMYDGTSHYIYSSMDFSQGATAQLVNTTTNYTIFEITFEDHNAVVTIPAKGVGDSIKITSAPGGTVTTRQLQAVDNVLTVSELISAAINNTAGIQVTSDVNYNILTLTANTPGEEGNNIVLTYDGGDYVGLYSEKMSGGKDISLEPGDYTVLLDYTKDKESYKVIHLQSRPMSFTEAYSIIRRMVLRCRAKLQTNDTNLSMYLFASNNMVDWACVAGSQKKGVTIDHIRLQRSARAYKYYIIIIGGMVRTDSELSYISAEIEERFNSKIR